MQGVGRHTHTHLCCAVGRVLMALHKAEVYPDWFKGGGESDAVALQRAGESCVVPCTIMLTRKFKLDQVRLKREGMPYCAQQQSALLVCEGDLVTDVGDGLDQQHHTCRTPASA